MTETPPPLTTWPTLADERILLAANPEQATKYRALIHRIRELEAELAKCEAAPELWECPRCGFGMLAAHYSKKQEYPCPACGELAYRAKVDELLKAAPSLTKVQVSAAAEKLFVAPDDSWHFGNIGSRSLADVVHLLCESLNVKE